MKAKYDFAPVPVLPDVNNLEPEVETEATAELLPTSIEQDLSTTTEHELDTAHPDEPAAIAEASPEIVLNADAIGVELQSEHEQETLTVLSPSSQETGVDVISSSKDALTAAETEVEAETHGTDTATTTNDLTAAEFFETEGPIMPTTEVFIFYSRENALADPVLPRKGDSTDHMNEAAIVAVGLAAAVGFSSIVPEVTHEATPDAGNDLVESGTTLDIEPQWEHEVDVAAPETEGTLPDILRNDPTLVPLPLEPEISLIKTGLEAEPQVETTSTATTNSVPIDVEVQPDSSSSETAPNAQKNIEEQIQVDDTSNIKDELILESDIAQHIDTADTEDTLEDVPASSTKQSENTAPLEPEVDFVAPAEEEPSAVTQVAAEDLLPKIESEAAISGETIPIPEDVTASVADVEGQVIAPVDVRSEDAAVVETSRTDELAEVILPPNVEESLETLTPLVEPSSYKSPDDEMVGVSVLPISMHPRSLKFFNTLKSHVVPEVDVHVPETQVSGEAALVSLVAAATVESDLGRGAAENMSVPSQELPVNAEPEEPVTHEEADEIPEVNVPITLDTYRIPNSS